MSSLVSARGPADHEWELYEGTIRSLYLAENRKLEGLGGVIDEMAKEHQFIASKAQYERHFKKWGIRKKRTKDDWKIIGQKIEKRKRDNKESIVHIDGSRVPPKKVRKETLRHGFVSAVEIYNQASTPQTPSGVTICTPAAMNNLHFPIDNLPLSQFEAHLGLREPAILPNGILSCLVNHFGKGSDQTENLESFRAIVKSVIPDTDALGESAATQMTLEQNDQSSMLGFLKMTMFFVTNGFLDGRNNVSQKIYSWLREQTNSQLLDYILSIKGPTTEALAENLFRVAIDAQDVAIVKKFLKAGLDPNEQVFQGWFDSPLTPLQYVCQLRNPELAQALIDAGANVNTKLHQGQGCALQYSIFPTCGECDSIDPASVEVVQILLHAGADPNQIETDSHYRSPLITAAGNGDVEMVTLLTSAGADVNLIPTVGVYRESALLASLHRGPSVPDEDIIAIVRILLNAGADVNLEGSYNRGDFVTALEAAVKRGSIELVQLLLSSRARVSESTLESAVTNNDLEMVKLLFNAGARLTVTVLKSSTYADIELLSFILDVEQNVTLNARNRSIALTGAINCGKTDRAIKLAESGARLEDNYRLADAITAASSRGDIQVLRWLLEAGSSRRATAIKWLGSSLCAAISHHQAEAATELLAAGANVNQEIHGTSALLLAIQKREAHLVRELLRLGAAVNRKIPLNEYSANFASTFTVLPAAVAWGDRSVIQDIIDAGAYIDAAEYEGAKTALAIAVEKKDCEMAKF